MKEKDNNEDENENEQIIENPIIIENLTQNSTTTEYSIPEKEHIQKAKLFFLIHQEKKIKFLIFLKNF